MRNYRDYSILELKHLVQAYFEKVSPGKTHKVAAGMHFNIRSRMELWDLNARFSVFIRCSFSLYLTSEETFEAAGLCGCTFFTICDLSFNVGYNFEQSIGRSALTGAKTELSSPICKSVSLPELLEVSKSGKHMYVFYKRRAYRFMKEAVVGGVEIELPTSYPKKAEAALHRRGWITQEDHSQIVGEVEIASRPYTLAYIKSERFLHKLREAYAVVEAPTELKWYGQANKNLASGLHLHISWESTGVSSSLVRNYIYRLFENCGGEDWVLEAGGKSPPALDCYSRYLPRVCCSRYNTVNVISPNHIELRYMNAHPNPAVVHERLQVAVEIAELALELAYNHSINEMHLKALPYKKEN